MTLQQVGVKLININLRAHFIIAALLRAVLLAYGEFQDKHSELPYTDIDYKVVTDGARKIINGRSPFERHTYRYSPIMAYLQIPNVLIHPGFGKLIYVIFDLLIAVLIYAIVRTELKAQCRKAVQSLLLKLGKVCTSQSKANGIDERNRPDNIARASACFWLYNPLTAVISTRGNGDSFSSFFVLLTIFLLAKSNDATELGTSIMHRNALIISAGIVHGFAIHLRIYPLVFSLAYFLSLSNYYVHTPRDFMRQLILPSAKQLYLIFGTFLSFTGFTLSFYNLYGWQYIYEAVLYHFIRGDARHNFSLYFLLQYLGSNQSNTTLIAKTVIVAPQVILIAYLSFSFGQFRQTLPFCVFTLSFIIVTFNSVVTSQYFIWYLAILPLCLNNLQNLSFLNGLFYFLLWLVAQGLWLLPAYLLEFQAWNTFSWIGLQSAVFFITNNFILDRIIKYYSFTSFKVNFKKLL